MAKGGGARGWLFLRRNLEFGDAFETRPDEAPVFEDAPFALRRQAASERGLGRFGLYGWEDPFAEDGPVSPFWSVAPMLDVVPVRGEDRGLAALARAAGTALAGLRLAGGPLILKLERGGRAQQLRIAEGDAFDPVRDSIEVRLRPDRPGVAGRHARSGELWRMLRVPGPPTGRGRGPGIASCCKRSTSRGPGGRSPGSPRRCGAAPPSRASGMRTTSSASGCGGASPARGTSWKRAT